MKITYLDRVCQLDTTCPSKKDLQGKSFQFRLNSIVILMRSVSFEMLTQIIL